MNCSPLVKEGYTLSLRGPSQCSMKECSFIWLALLLLSLVLLASVCLNLILCLLRHKRSTQCKDQNASRDSVPQDEEAYSRDTDNCTPEENSHSVHLQQENPIYGNITTKDTGCVVYEEMAVRARGRTKPAESDLNYASLDLKLAKKRKRKQSHQQGLVPGQDSPPDQLHDRLIQPHVLEEEDVCLPPIDHSPMGFHSTIYLNSQQIDLEREDNEAVHLPMCGEERAMGWKPEQESLDEVGNEESSNDRRSLDEHKMQDNTDHIVRSDVNKL
ncbi:hypothetical protein NL108_005690 [Boleophthalmus pectinirostris]|uniref:uncharacterized protein LOC110158631 n=1 Tax=Boleophthalmus pectinirostris TaxID=150288 RepID=UPI00242A95C7|nr:uncharacterized protein LOC110158631 [Boleophthalmus pectinirostris]KAJ0061556.1 hypothetical protein NL108_005690 [Boleophthalmus pectinirostris]